MSKVIEKKFDLAAGHCIVTIEDQNQNRSVHTIALVEHDGKEANVEAHIQARLKEARILARKRRRVARRHGWRPSDR